MLERWRLEAVNRGEMCVEKFKVSLSESIANTTTYRRPVESAEMRVAKEPVVDRCNARAPYQR